jgi:hypothetical protein
MLTPSYESKRRQSVNQHSSDESMLNSQMEDCIQDCFNSHAVCLDTAMNLLQKGHTYANPVRILLDCSELCATNAHFMMRNSSVYGSVCQCAGYLLNPSAIDFVGECKQYCNGTIQGKSYHREPA